MSAAIVPIVEGFSEVESVPVLLRRLLDQQNAHHISIARPFRVKRYGVVRPNELERAIKQALRDRSEARGIVVLLDADDDCPAKLGPALLARARVATALPTAVVLAQKEFECWFLGAKESLRGVSGIRDDAMAPHNPEEIRGAKERLTQNMVAGRRYLEVDDQPVLASRMDIEEARGRCQSFAKLLTEFGILCSAIKADKP